jgi:16S rRNA (cytosine1402-N4)-methyltransferase
VTEAKHIPVLLNEILGSFNLKNSEKILDCTFGGGGHSRAFLEACPAVSVVAIDKDPEAGERVKGLVSEYGDRIRFYDMSFDELDKIEEDEFDCILFDLGVSSFQLDDPQRGFSFRFESDVDMRLDPREGLSAGDFLERASYEDLVKAVRDYGEEDSWRKVVHAIENARGSGILRNTQSFADLVAGVVRNKSRGKPNRINPATKTFQGIRMAINDEIGQIERALPKAFDKLAIGGILAVISFHSLEDRLIKRFFRRMAGRPEHRLDSTPGDMRETYGKMLNSRPITATEEEIMENPRSRSARLRILKKERNIHHE